MNKKGFTLIELLVVVLIIGILSAVALPQYQKTVLKSRAAEAWTNLGTLQTAGKIYCLENPNGHAPFYEGNYDELSIEIKDSKYFRYQMDVYCSGGPTTSHPVKTFAYYQPDDTVLSINSHGIRSCNGTSCKDLGFTMQGSGLQCSCGGSQTCYYIN